MARPPLISRDTYELRADLAQSRSAQSFKGVHVKHRSRRPARPQMSGLLSLKVMLPDPSQGMFTTHFRTRMNERGFDLNLLNQLWNGDAWSPTDDNRWLIEEPKAKSSRRWSLVVDFAEDDTPVFVTVCDRIDRSQWEVL